MRAEYIKIAFNNILKRRLRSWLTMIGIFIGISAVVALISLGQGAQAAIDEEFAKSGADRIVIQPAGGFSTSPISVEMTSEKLVERDIEIVKGVRGVDVVTPMRSKIARVKFKDETKGLFIIAISTDKDVLQRVETVDFLRVEKGRQLTPQDQYKAIAGKALADDLFERSVAIGDKLIIDEVEFEVVGIQKDSGNPGQNAMVRIPTDTAKELFEFGDDIGTMMVWVKDAKNIDDVADRIARVLRKEHDVEVGQEDFTIQTASQIVEGFKQIFGAVTAVLIGIAFISLIVGGIGIMNTMYTSVLERTKEIGIMKAIGARNSDVLQIFLTEAGVLGFVGGLIGLAIGAGISKLVEFAIGVQYGISLIKAVFPTSLLVGAMVFSVGVGILSGALPALQAAKMNPVDALRK
ncbi:ABC transporter permease [Candidatus Woesearchaeota archaeon]|nr:ABC transporter permease [Candidatus Woesearchaeota archaeon]